MPAFCSADRYGFRGAQKGAPSINWNSTDILSDKDLSFEQFGPLSFLIPVLTYKVRKGGSLSYTLSIAFERSQLKIKIG